MGSSGDAFAKPARAGYRRWFYMGIGIPVKHIPWRRVYLVRLQKYKFSDDRESQLSRREPQPCRGSRYERELNDCLTFQVHIDTCITRRYILRRIKNDSQLYCWTEKHFSRRGI